MKIRHILLILATVTFASAVIGNSDREQQIADRLAPIGSTCMAGDPCASASAGAADAGPADPESVYNTYCMACHTTGAAGAPKIGVAADWEPRLANGLDSLYANAINGIGGMPARGICMSCSDEDIQATVDYILEQSK